MLLQTHPSGSSRRPQPFLSRILRSGSFVSVSVAFTLGFCVVAAIGVHGAAPIGLTLSSQVEVDGEGVFLSQIVEPVKDRALPVIRLADPPAIGRNLVVTRDEIQRALFREAPAWPGRITGGPMQVFVTRRTRVLDAPEVVRELTSAIQNEYVRDRGELDLQLSRRWNPVVVPDEFFDFRILDMPSNGISSSFIIRFEIANDRESFGVWQLPVTARIWKDIWVAAAPLKRGETLRTADMETARHDLLRLREEILDSVPSDIVIELTRNLRAGTPVTVNMIRERPMVFRGQVVDGLIQDGPLTIALKVVLLENGRLGEMVRVRNPQTRRELRGIVENENNINLSL